MIFPEQNNPIFQGISILDLFYFMKKKCGGRSNTDILELIYFHWIALKIKYNIFYTFLPKNKQFLPNWELRQ